MTRRGPRAHLEYQELLYLEPDGELTPAEQRDLDAHVSRCGECRSVRGELVSLGSLMAESRVTPDSQLARRVLAGLPPAHWEMRQPASWRAAAAVFVGLLLASYLTFRGQAVGEAAPWMATLSAVADLFRSTALAGAGLLTASWAGFGLALGEVLGQSRFGFLVFGLFVLGVDVLFLRYVWRLSRGPVVAASTGGRRRTKSG